MSSLPVVPFFVRTFDFARLHALVEPTVVVIDIDTHVTAPADETQRDSEGAGTARAPGESEWSSSR